MSGIAELRDCAGAGAAADFTSDARLMGDLVNSRWVKRIGWLIVAIVVALNGWLIIGSALD